jgi:hypothetical protein
VRKRDCRHSHLNSVRSSLGAFATTSRETIVTLHTRVEDVMRPLFILIAILLACGVASPAAAQSLTRDDVATVPLPPAADMPSSAFRIQSIALGESRSVLVGLPPSFAKTRRAYPVLLVLDGEERFPDAMTAAGYLAAAGQVPEMIVVGVPNNGHRLRDLTPPGISVSGSTLREGGDRFLDFLERELMPALKTQFRADGLVVLAGHSSGGILATYAAATRPAFRLILAIDTPVHLGDGWLAKQLATRASAGSPGHLRYVSTEARFGWTDSLWARATRAAPSTWRLARRSLERETHNSMTLLSFYLGLRTLFEDYATMSAPESPTTRTLAHYRQLETSYGVPMTPPAPLLRRVFDDLEMEGQSAAASDAYRQLVTGFGTPADSVAWTYRLAQLAKQPPMTETVDGLLATPHPSSAVARHLIGEWRGQHWMNPEAKSDFVLRLRDSSGVLVGESISRPAPGVELVQKLTYLRVVDGGFDYGYMNGMRPRGMLIHEGRFSGDTLKGQMRFGGIRFNGPDGQGPPAIYFALRKVP